jgi:hypothetical protein
MRGATLTEAVRPVRSQMDLDVGRLNPREAVQLVGLTVGSLFVATLAALLLWLVWPKEFETWSAVRFVFAAFALGLGLLAGGFGVVVARLTLDDWTEYRGRLNEWHAVAIAAYEANGGREQVRELTVWDLSPSMPLHVLGVALSAHRRVQQGQDTPWSVRALEGPVMLGGRRLGTVSRSAAEEFSRDLAKLGLVSGRAPGRAGTWAASSEAQVVELVVNNWRKLGRPDVASDASDEASIAP